MSGAEKVTLGEWFSSAARKPFISILFFLLSMQLLAYSIHVYRSYRTAKEFAALLGSVFDLGVLQSNRLLVEKLAALAVGYEFTGVILCDHDDLLYSSGYWDSVTCNTQPALFSSVISVPLLNSKSKRAIFYYPYFKDYISSLIFALGPSLLLLLVIRQIRKILARIRNDLIDPLVASVRFIDATESQTNPSGNFSVIEINELFKAYQSKVIELKTAVTTQAELDKQAEIGRITANLSHDMRAPLASIERLLLLPGDTPITSYAPTIRESLFRLNAMIESLRFSDIERMVNMSRCILNIDKILSGLTGKAASNKIALITQGISPNKDVSVLLDYSKFERAIANLVSNALDFAQDTVTVSVELRGTALTLKVLDNGPGVPDDFLPRLFQRGATRGKHDGTGLGLAYVRQIMRGHGGDVTYRRENNMTVFECYLPNAVVDLKKMERRSSLEENKKPDISATKPGFITRVSICFQSAELGQRIHDRLTGINPGTHAFMIGADPNSDIVLTDSDEIADDAALEKKRLIMFDRTDSDDEIVRRVPFRLGIKG